MILVPFFHADTQLKDVERTGWSAKTPAPVLSLMKPTKQKATNIGPFPQTSLLRFHFKLNTIPQKSLNTYPWPNEVQVEEFFDEYFLNRSTVSTVEPIWFLSSWDCPQNGDAIQHLRVIRSETRRHRHQASMDQTKMHHTNGRSSMQGHLSSICQGAFGYGPDNPWISSAV